MPSASPDTRGWAWTGSCPGGQTRGSAKQLGTCLALSLCLPVMPLVNYGFLVAKIAPTHSPRGVALPW